MKGAPERSTFELAPERVLGGKYRVVERLGGGWEGEVYRVEEVRTGIEHAVKLFFPHRDPERRALVAYARKLDRLRDCRIVIRYRTEEQIRLRGEQVRMLVAELVHGVILEELIRSLPGRRMPPYMALHLLHALASGMEEIHALGEYHGDLHSENVVVVRAGLRFELRLLDMYYWGAPTRANIHHDTVEMVRLFHDALGGRRHYARHPDAVKRICRGMRPTLILERFDDAGALRRYLEKLSWFD